MTGVSSDDQRKKAGRKALKERKKEKKEKKKDKQNKVKKEGVCEKYL